MYLSMYIAFHNTAPALYDTKGKNPKKLQLNIKMHEQ